MRSPVGGWTAPSSCIRVGSASGGWEPGFRLHMYQSVAESQVNMRFQGIYMASKTKRGRISLWRAQGRNSSADTVRKEGRKDERNCSSGRVPVRVLSSPCPHPSRVLSLAQSHHRSAAYISSRPPVIPRDSPSSRAPYHIQIRTQDDGDRPLPLFLLHCHPMPNALQHEARPFPRLAVAR